VENQIRTLESPSSRNGSTRQAINIKGQNPTNTNEEKEAVYKLEIDP
jgi:hypothetical protein